MDDLLLDYARMLQRIRVALIDDYTCSETVDGVLIRKLFVTNLAQRTTFRRLEDCFSVYGTVESCHMRREKGKPAYAFVTFSNVDDAVRALRDGVRKQIRLHGRDLRVRPADSHHQPDYVPPPCTEEERKEAAEKLRIVGYLPSDSETAPIHTLNDNCLNNIFEYLSLTDRIRIERVCRRWRAVRERAWRSTSKITISSYKWRYCRVTYTYQDVLPKLLAKCGPYLTELNLDSSDCRVDYSRRMLNMVCRLCPNLKSIDTTLSVANGSNLLTMATTLTNLTRLCIGRSTYRCDRDLTIIFNVNQNLKHFEIIRNNEMTGKCLLHLPVSLETLILEGCILHAVYLMPALKRLTNLKHIDIRTPIQYRTLQVIARHCTNLETLYLDTRFTDAKTEKDLVPVTYFLNLRVLKMTWSDLITNDFLFTIAVRCRHLTDINLAYCSVINDFGVWIICKLPKLEVLTLNDMPRITGLGLRSANNLRKLKCRRCPLLGEEEILMVLKSSPLLQLLDVWKSPNITPAIIDKAEELCAHRCYNLMLKLVVGEFPGYTEFPSRSVKQVCPLLQVIHLNDEYMDPAEQHKRLLVKW